MRCSPPRSVATPALNHVGCKTLQPLRNCLCACWRQSIFDQLFGQNHSLQLEKKHRKVKSEKRHLLVGNLKDIFSGKIIVAFSKAYLKILIRLNFILLIYHELSQKRNLDFEVKPLNMRILLMLINNMFFTAIALPLENYFVTVYQYSFYSVDFRLLLLRTGGILIK